MPSSLPLPISRVWATVMPSSLPLPISRVWVSVTSVSLSQLSRRTLVALSGTHRQNPSTALSGLSTSSINYTVNLMLTMTSHQTHKTLRGWSQERGVTQRGRSQERGVVQRGRSQERGMAPRGQSLEMYSVFLLDNGQKITITILRNYFIRYNECTQRNVRTFVFGQLFHSDIEYLLSMEKLWQSRRPPLPLDLSNLPQTEGAWATHTCTHTDETTPSITCMCVCVGGGCSSGGLADQRIWSITECAQVFLDW